MDERLEALFSEISIENATVEPDWEACLTTTPSADLRAAEAGGCGRETSCPTCGGRATVDVCRVVQGDDPFCGVEWLETAVVRYTVRCWKDECPAHVEDHPEGDPEPDFAPPPRERCQELSRRQQIRIRKGLATKDGKLPAAWNWSERQAPRGKVA